MSQTPVGEERGAEDFNVTSAHIYFCPAHQPQFLNTEMSFRVVNYVRLLPELSCGSYNSPPFGLFHVWKSPYIRYKLIYSWADDLWFFAFYL